MRARGLPDFFFSPDERAQRVNHLLKSVVPVYSQIRYLQHTSNYRQHLTADLLHSPILRLQSHRYVS
jgi:hypothetical protein